MTENPGNSSPRVGANSASSGTEPSPATSTTPEGAKMGVRRKGETEETERRPYSPLELRLQLYNEVHGLRGEGLSYTRIIEAIERRHGVTLSRSHISQWLRGIHRPGGSCNHFDAKPSPALSYIIGTVLRVQQVPSRSPRPKEAIRYTTPARTLDSRSGQHTALQLPSTAIAQAHALHRTLQRLCRHLPWSLLRRRGKHTWTTTNRP